jgi:hypothetical protein
MPKKIQKEDKKINKGYRAKESVYQRAMKRAKKDKTTLGALIENVVTAYARGDKIIIEGGPFEPFQ